MSSEDGKGTERADGAGGFWPGALHLLHAPGPRPPNEHIRRSPCKAIACREPRCPEWSGIKPLHSRDGATSRVSTVVPGDLSGTRTRRIGSRFAHRAGAAGVFHQFDATGRPTSMATALPSLGAGRHTADLWPQSARCSGPTPTPSALTRRAIQHHRSQGKESFAPCSLRRIQAHTASIATAVAAPLIARETESQLWK